MSSSSSRRKAEERTTKVLRELAGEAGNKTCFDCHQRGPTYINMTIGAFVCTGCSGILRGLNPPHRVKSISMATFGADEIDFLRQRGNVFCRRVWLGLYDGSRQDGARDEQQMKDFLALKYEKRRWYVEPAEVARQDSLKDARSVAVPTAPASPPASPLAALGHAVQPPSKEAARPHPHAQQSAPHQPSLDLFAEDPFASPVQASKPLPGAQPTPFALAQAKSQPPSQPLTNGGGFADFEANFAELSFTSAPSQPPAPPPAFAPATAPVPRPPPGFGTPFLPPTTQTQPMHKSATMPPTSSASATSNADKYSALKELDSLFRFTHPITSLKANMSDWRDFEAPSPKPRPLVAKAVPTAASTAPGQPPRPPPSRPSPPSPTPSTSPSTSPRTPCPRASPPWAPSPPRPPTAASATPSAARRRPPASGTPSSPAAPPASASRPGPRPPSPHPRHGLRFGSPSHSPVSLPHKMGNSLQNGGGGQSWNPFL